MIIHPFQHYARARHRCLARLRRLRELGVPPAIIRHEQLFFWSMRQMHATVVTAPALIPGWAENYQRFLLSLSPEGNA